MTTTTLNPADAIVLPTIPTLTPNTSWNEFVAAIVAADEEAAEIIRQSIPTPKITAERGTKEWLDGWDAQRAADYKRSRKQLSFQVQLIKAIGEAFEMVVPTFESLDIEYTGSGDSGEVCSVSVLTTYPTFVRDEKGFAIVDEEAVQQYRAASAEADLFLTPELKEWLDETCWSIAYDQNPGFEIDEGGWGTIRAARETNDDPMQLTIQHNARSVENYAEEVLG